MRGNGTIVIERAFLHRTRLGHVLSRVVHGHGLDAMARGDLLVERIEQRRVHHVRRRASEERWNV